jgi:hypothetical protein
MYVYAARVSNLVMIQYLIWLWLLRWITTNLVALLALVFAIVSFILSMKKEKKWTHIVLSHYLSNVHVVLLIIENNVHLVNKSPDLMSLKSLTCSWLEWFIKGAKLYTLYVYVSTAISFEARCALVHPPLSTLHLFIPIYFLSWMNDRDLE